jgi:hypothetical protein
MWIMGTLHEELCTSVVISHSILCQVRNISYRFVHTFKTHALCSITFFILFFYFFNCTIKEIMWKNVTQPWQASDDSIVWCMCVACYMTNTTGTHSEYLIGLLIALPWQHWLCDQTSVLYVHCHCFCTSVVKCDAWNIGLF